MNLSSLVLKCLQKHFYTHLFILRCTEHGLPPAFDKETEVQASQVVAYYHVFKIQNYGLIFHLFLYFLTK